MDNQEREALRDFLKKRQEGDPDPLNPNVIRRNPNDTREYKNADNNVTNEDLRFHVISNYGTDEQKAAWLKQSEERAAAEQAAAKSAEEANKPEEPIHPEKEHSPEFLHAKYGNNIHKGFTKEQLEGAASSEFAEIAAPAIAELQRRYVLELERENKKLAAEKEAEMKALNDKYEADKRQAEIEARVAELKIQADLGHPGAVGEILKLRGKL